MIRYRKTLLCGAMCLLAGLMNSCYNNINLEPEGFVSPDGYFTSVNDYEKALNGVYDRFNYDNYALWMDGVSDNGLINQSWNWGYDLVLGFGSSQSSLSTDRWKRDYISIQRANNVIDNIDRMEWPGGKEDKDRNRILGEAQAVRAFFYLDLVSTYGRIMFYSSNPATVAEAEELKQVEDIESVFQFVIDDLETAIKGLPEVQSSKFRFGQTAARLLRARAASYAAGYLDKKEYYQITLQETEEILKTAPVLGEYNDLFVEGCEGIDEVLLCKGYSKDKTNGWGNWYNQSIAGFCVTVPTGALVNSYEYIGAKDEKMPYLNKDPRLYASIYVPGMMLRNKYYNTVPDNIIKKDGKAYFDPSKDYGSLQDAEVWEGDVLGDGIGSEWNKTMTGFSWKKYCQGEETWTTYNSFIIFRYAEAYLLRAEALVETGGDINEAKELVKVIRNRARNTNDIDWAVNSLYNGSLRDLIRNEFRVEFAQEGLRLYDLRRWKILLEEMNKPIIGLEYRDYSSGTPQRKVYTPATRVNYTEKDYWWPIPQSEIDLNKGRITQNNGW